jgi:hypothetical protein
MSGEFVVKDDGTFGLAEGKVQLFDSDGSSCCCPSSYCDDCWDLREGHSLYATVRGFADFSYAGGLTHYYSKLNGTFEMSPMDFLPYPTCLNYHNVENANGIWPPVPEMTSPDRVNYSNTTQSWSPASYTASGLFRIRFFRTQPYFNQQVDYRFRLNELFSYNSCGGALLPVSFRFHYIDNAFGPDYERERGVTENTSVTLFSGPSTT